MVTSLLSIKLRPKAETSACHVITNSQSFNRWMRSRINHWMRRSLVRCRVILMSIAKSLQKAQLMSKAHPIALPQLFALLPRVEAAHRTPAPPPLAVLPHAASQHHNLTPPPPPMPLLLPSHLFCSSSLGATKNGNPGRQTLTLHLPGE